MRLAATLLAAATLCACDPAQPPAGGTAVPTATHSQLATDLAAVRRARIFFSHHSVGENILAGIQQVAADTGAPLSIVPLEQSAGASGPVLVHGSGGRNKDPESKIAFFEATLRNPQLQPDVAVMKFCYVDFNPGTDVDALLARYRRAIEALKRERPEVRFAHVTVPLTPRSNDVKSWTRRLLGLEEWSDAANAKRHEFNRKLVAAFPADPVFDLARIESTAPDGAAVAFSYHGEAVPAMAPAYNADNGHLNALGQRASGAAAIGFFAAALRSASGIRH